MNYNLLFNQEKHLITVDMIINNEFKPAIAVVSDFDSDKPMLQLNMPLDIGIVQKIISHVNEIRYRTIADYINLD